MRAGTKWLVAATSMSLLLASIGCEAPKLAPGTAPMVLVNSTALPEAMVGSGYDVQLSAQGGTPPYLFSLADLPAELSWLMVDGATGQLSGVAPTALPGGVRFTVKVHDALGASIDVTVSLKVIICRDGDRVVCYASDGASCLVSTVICSGGLLPTCGAGVASKDVLQCGPGDTAPGCGSCDPTRANACEGTCRCGATASCGASQACCAANCADLVTSLGNCGSCGNSCPTSGLAPNSHATCVDGACGAACDPGFTNCGGTCKNLLTDVANCGACGTACTGLDARCNGAGVCQASCAPGTTSCGASCYDLFNDPQHCGACTTACPLPIGGTATCAVGGCGTACPAGGSDCSGTCQDLQTDPANCGACGTVCTAPLLHSSSFCAAGGCDFACDPGYKFCDSTGTCILRTSACKVICLLPICP